MGALLTEPFLCVINFLGALRLIFFILLGGRYQWPHFMMMASGQCDI